jgi:hypothetical protein
MAMGQHTCVCVRACVSTSSCISNTRIVYNPPSHLLQLDQHTLAINRPVTAPPKIFDGERKCLFGVF